MSLTTVLIGSIGLISVLALVLSGKLRTLTRAFLGLFVENLAATPEGADALFRQKEEEIESKFRRADNAFKSVSGKRKRLMDEVDELKQRLSQIERQCEFLAARGDDDGLDIKVAERAETLEEINIRQETLVGVNQAYKDAGEARSACEEALNQVKRQRKQVVSRMKTNRDMKDIYADLEGIGADDRTSRLLERVMEKDEELSDHAAGSREAYDAKISTRSKRLNQRIAGEVNDQYKAQLKAKYTAAPKALPSGVPSGGRIIEVPQKLSDGVTIKK